jgi:hypothetical protein
MNTALDDSKKVSNIETEATKTNPIPFHTHFSENVPGNTYKKRISNYSFLVKQVSFFSTTFDSKNKLFLFSLALGIFFETPAPNKSHKYYSTKPCIII